MVRERPHPARACVLCPHPTWARHTGSVGGWYTYARRPAPVGRPRRRGNERAHVDEVGGGGWPSPGRRAEGQGAPAEARHRGAALPPGRRPHGDVGRSPPDTVRRPDGEDRRARRDARRRADGARRPRPAQPESVVVTFDDGTADCRRGRAAGLRRARGAGAAVPGDRASSRTRSTSRPTGGRRRGQALADGLDDRLPAGGLATPTATRCSTGSIWPPRRRRARPIDRTASRTGSASSPAHFAYPRRWRRSRRPERPSAAGSAPPPWRAPGQPPGGHRPLAARSHPDPGRATTMRWFRRQGGRRAAPGGRRPSRSPTAGATGATSREPPTAQGRCTSPRPT